MELDDMSFFRRTVRYLASRGVRFWNQSKTASAGGGVVLLAVASIDEAEHFILVATDDFHDPILSPPIQWPSADEVVAS